MPALYQPWTKSQAHIVPDIVDVLYMWNYVNVFLMYRPAKMDICNFSFPAAALHEALTSEVQRLKLAAGELREEGRLPNGMTQQMPVKHNMFPMQRQQPSQIQQLSVGKQTTASSASATPASA